MRRRSRPAAPAALRAAADALDAAAWSPAHPVCHQHRLRSGGRDVGHVGRGPSNRSATASGTSPRLAGAARGPRLHTALGLRWAGGKLYVSHVITPSKGRVTAFTWFDGKRFAKQLVALDGLRVGRHTVDSIIQAPDGRLFVGVGSGSTTAGARGASSRGPPAGTPASWRRACATPTGWPSTAPDLLVTDNGRDDLGSTAAGGARRVRPAAARLADFGFPRCYDQEWPRRAGKRDRSPAARPTRPPTGWRSRPAPPTSPSSARPSARTPSAATSSGSSWPTGRRHTPLDVARRPRPARRRDRARTATSTSRCSSAGRSCASTSSGLPDQRRQRLRRPGLGEIVALREVAAQRAQAVDLGDRLDPLGDGAAGRARGSAR